MLQVSTITAILCLILLGNCVSHTVLASGGAWKHLLSALHILCCMMQCVSPVSLLTQKHCVIFQGGKVCSDVPRVFSAFLLQQHW